MLFIMLVCQSILFNGQKLTLDMLQAWAQDTSRFGYQQLLKYGWSDGKGLGANLDGITSHLRVVQKTDLKGPCQIELPSTGIPSHIVLYSSAPHHSRIVLLTLFQIFRRRNF